MLSIVKKIVLFLFGIGLIVFGNKAAINTIFKSENKGEDTPPIAKDSEVKDAVVTETVEEAPQQVDEPEILPKTEKPSEKKVAEKPKATQSKTEKPKDVTPKVAEKKAEEPVQEKVVEKAEVKEAPKTVIEPEQSETASGSE